MKIKHASLKRNPNTTWHDNNQIELAAFFSLRPNNVWFEEGELGIDSWKTTDLDNSSQPIPTQLQMLTKDSVGFAKVNIYGI